MHAATIGIPDARLGKRNCLRVVLKQDVVPAVEEFVAFLRAGRRLQIAGVGVGGAIQ
jgi:non-ribosomal peptide synthetase component E (peptide arylation enzyme)